MSDRRPPAVAGRFYPGDARALDEEVAARIGDAAAARGQLGVVAPHAGYVYSGATAGKLYASTRIPRRAVVLAPNHTGRGARLSVWPSGAFALPGGDLPVDEELASRLLGRAGLSADHDAHLREHAIEVQLPFLRALNPAVAVVPIVLGPLDWPRCRELAEVLAGELDDETVVVASSDMNHYLPDEVARARDARALEPLLALDPAALHARVLAEDHSMCGFVPATVMLAFAIARGAQAAELIHYSTSGDAFGERDQVVGYAGVAVH